MPEPPAAWAQQKHLLVSTCRWASCSVATRAHLQENQVGQRLAHALIAEELLALHRAAWTMHARRVGLRAAHGGGGLGGRPGRASVRSALTSVC